MSVDRAPGEPAGPGRYIRGHTCRRGHRLTPSNTIVEVDRDGRQHRKCRWCTNARARARRAADAAHRERRNRESAAAYRRHLAAGLPDGDERHGTINGYNSYGCRCEPCTAAIVEYHRKRKARKRAQQEHLELDQRAARAPRALSLERLAEEAGDAPMGFTRWDDPAGDLAVALADLEYA